MRKIGAPFSALSNQRGHGLAGEAIELKRSRNALGVIGVQSCCSLGVKVGKLRMQKRPALHLCFPRNLLADFQGHTGKIIQAFLIGLEIEHGAAHQKR